MSIGLHETRTDNQYVEALRQTMDIEHTMVDCLIIAHADQRMIRRLTEAMEDQAVAVLPLGQSDWDSHLGGIVAWAVDAGISQVLIVGHSHGIESIQPQFLARGEQLNAAAGDVSPSRRLVASARRNEQQLRDSKAHFSDQLAQLRDCEELCDKQCSDDFVLSALFYLATGGVFLQYSLSDGTFEPLS